MMGKIEMQCPAEPRPQVEKPTAVSTAAGLPSVDEARDQNEKQLHSCNPSEEMGEGQRHPTELFRNLWAQLDIGIACHGMFRDLAGEIKNFRILDANEAFIDMIGIDPRGKTAAEVFPDVKLDFSGWLAIFNLVAQTGKPGCFEQYMSASGQWYECSVYLIKPEVMATTFLNITDRKKNEEGLQYHQTLYRALVDQSFEAVALIDIRTQEIVEMNRRFTEQLGYSLSQDAPLYVGDIAPDLKAELDQFSKSLRRQQSAPVATQTVFHHKNGAEVSVEISGTEITAAGQEYWLSTIRNVTEERRQRQELGASQEQLRIKQDLLEKTKSLLVESQQTLLQQATHDSLTGLLNQRAALKLLSKELARNKRRGGELAIGICDIDNFKSINDTWGHQTGNEVLCWFAQTLTASVREYDTVARIGGEEFLLIIPLNPGGEAETVFERCCSQIANSKIETTGGELGITVSIGVAYASVGSVMKKLLSEADTALNQAKARGRNRVVYFMKP